ncbi:TrkH family potassium uptake protein [Pseudoclavibacter chungangensis]|uniref:TrkH family potassium uptake protein n=1 Tax=Pseudoclavibacter chungangensis TaxID=587635 RepID=A0A7J5BQ45_9MICO|nr:potassium transporter TrkG [Pseudoclavibacter chungangensis]KAB1655666.1 TrkH family potassium uptake protein [Pseudoclavibacter chungangensis]NYJ67926.1 Trk-type K+ transport system membrane component [Pseudoclavibacter chungangensis]
MRNRRHPPEQPRINRRGHVSRTLAGRLRDFVDDFAHSSPSRFAVLVFTSIIMLWTLLLTLPISSASGHGTPFHEALFTAVSTICVTGLSIVDMSTHWSPFGHAVVFVGLEVGAVGVLTLASIMGAIVARRLGLRQKLMAASDSNPMRIHAGPVSESQAIRLGEIGGMLVTVAVSLLIIETVIALLIIPRLLFAGFDLGTAIIDGFYYSASAFTNTGFTPNPDGLEPFKNDLWMLGCLAAAVFAGSLGFPVIFALVRWVRHRQRFSVHVKMTLVTTVALFLVGWLVLYLLEADNPETIGAFHPLMRPFQAGFLSAMTRSGGFSTIPIDETEGATMLVLDMLMFVGGGSASTAGGIKVTTLAILFLAAFAEAKGVNDMQAFGRRIPGDVLRLAVSVSLWGATIVSVSAILLMHFADAPFSHALFESISAFATCGLSSGLTQQLPVEGTYILTATMWLGRVGTVTMAAALASSEHKQLYRLPEERIIVG